jgi:hypothetical protein
MTKVVVEFQPVFSSSRHKNVNFDLFFGANNTIILNLSYTTACTSSPPTKMGGKMCSDFFNSK